MYSKQSQSELRRRTETNGGAFLPEDLIFEILPWLPALSLIRFKSVKKSWRDLIESPNFAAKHLRNQIQSSSGKSLLLMRQFSTNSDEMLHRFSLIFFADDGNDTSTVSKFIDFPVYTAYTGDCWLRVSGYCHGIICFSDLNGYVALANPGIRQFRVLPDTCISFPSTEPTSDLYIDSGFGYDPVSGDYKVVRAWISVDDNVNHRVEVYTLSNDSWREINNFEPFLQLLVWSRGPGKYLNGAYYWWIEVEEEEEGEENEEIVSYSIIVFDMSKEVFLQIHWPHPYSYSPREILQNRLSIMNGSLVLVTRHKPGTSKFFDIWVITRTEEDGGIGVTKLETIGPLNGVKDVPVFWKNKEILFESWDDLRIVSYKKGASEMKLLPVVLSHNFRLPRDVIAEVYTCSLISIARGE